MTQLNGPTDVRELPRDITPAQVASLCQDNYDTFTLLCVAEAAWRVPLV